MFQSALADIKEANTLAIDVEFENKYSFEMVVSLIQISTGKKIYLFDAIALDLQELGTVFENNSIIKLFFAGIQDIQILQTVYQWQIKSILDLSAIHQIINESSNQISLNEMILDVLNIDLPKDKQIQSKENWKQRPLPIKMLEYAAGDVKYLHKSLVTMQKQLNSDQQQLLEVYFQQIPLIRNLEPITLISAFHFASIFSINRGEDKYLLYKLVQFRDQIAKKANMSAGYILSKKQLRILVKDKPRNIKMLKKFNLYNGHIKQYHQQLLDLMNTTKQEFHSKNRDQSFYEINGIFHDHFPYYKNLNNEMQWPYTSSIGSYRNRQGILRIIQEMILDKVDEIHLPFIFSKYLIHGLAKTESINLNDLRPQIDEVSSFEDGIQLSRHLIDLVEQSHQS